MPATDRELIIGVVEILAAVGEHGQTVERLAQEASVRINRNVMVHHARDAVQFAERKGWVQERVDEWGEPRWYITPRGMRASQEFDAA